jgi:hypothetical protein
MWKRNVNKLEASFEMPMQSTSYVSPSMKKKFSNKFQVSFSLRKLLRQIWVDYDLKNYLNN